MLERFTGQCEGVSSEKGSETGLKASEKAEKLKAFLKSFSSGTTRFI